MNRRAQRRAAGRPPAIRLRSDTHEYTVTDLLHGTYTGVVDDFVLRRGDNVPAYNLAVVVDDANGFVYYSDENTGIRKYQADPDAADASSELARSCT
mgnify:CR=1 FL=1